MKLTKFKQKVTSKVGRQLLIAQKHSPVVMFGAGMVGVGATVVLACRATLKVNDLLEESDKAEQELDNADNITVEETDKKRLSVKVNTALQIGKLYAPSIIVGVATVGLLTGSHHILNKRNAGLAAAYTALDKGFKDYRGRVVEKYGEQQDEEFRFGVVETEIAVDTDEGVAVKTVKHGDPELVKSGHSIYARVFDQGNKDWSPDYGINQLRLRSVQTWANLMLQSNGHLFLNEVYDELNLPRDEAGGTVGWIKGHGDDFVDLGFEKDHRFVRGDERNVILDFNVDGPILHLI